MPTHFSISAWEIPWTEEPAGYGSWGRRVGHDVLLNSNNYALNTIRDHFSQSSHLSL